MQGIFDTDINYHGRLIAYHKRFSNRIPNKPVLTVVSAAESRKSTRLNVYTIKGEITIDGHVISVQKEASKKKVAKRFVCKELLEQVRGWLRKSDTPLVKQTKCKKRGRKKTEERWQMDIYMEIITPNTSLDPKDDPNFNWVGLLCEYHMQNSTAYEGKPQFTFRVVETGNLFETQVTMWAPNNKVQHHGEGVGATKKISKQAAAKDIIIKCLGYEKVIKTHHARKVDELPREAMKTQFEQADKGMNCLNFIFPTV